MQYWYIEASLITKNIMIMHSLIFKPHLYSHLPQVEKVMPVRERQDPSCILRIHILLVQSALTEAEL